jgi:hypothetical protein
LPWTIALVIALLVLANLPAWLTGARPIGTFEVSLIQPAVALGLFIAQIDILGRIARAAFEEFRPALGLAEAEEDRLRAELVSVPDRIGLPAIVLCMVGITLGYSLDPAATSSTASLSAVDATMATLLWLPVTALVAFVGVRTIRQLRLVGRLHAMASGVDLLDPGPIHAFSKFTAATALGILFVGILFAIPEGETSGVVAIEMVGAVVFTTLAIASFVLPLRGMHGRLVAEKERLIKDVNSRLKSILGRLHQAVDSDDLTRADGLQKTQGALLAERELYLRLSTWPWSQGTFRGFVSAVVLPVLLAVVFRLLGRFV